MRIRTSHLLFSLWFLAALPAAQAFVPPTKERALPPLQGSFAGGGICTSGVGCQLPDGQPHDGTLSLTSDLGNAFRARGNFEVLAAGTITEVCWWGLFNDFGLQSGCTPAPGEEYTITYFANDAGGEIPGSVLAGPFSVLPNMGLSGVTVFSGFGFLPEYAFSASHPPVPVVASERVWIEIFNNVDGPCDFTWSCAPPGDLRATQSTLAGTPLLSWSADLAFCVDVDTEPNAFGQPGTVTLLAGQGLNLDVQTAPPAVLGSTWSATVTANDPIHPQDGLLILLYSPRALANGIVIDLGGGSTELLLNAGFLTQPCPPFQTYTAGTGVACPSVPIPNDPTLLGAIWATQVVVGTPSTGFKLTNGLRGEVGSF